MRKASILILAGQSNAVGVGHVAYLPRHFSPEKITEFEVGYPRVRINYFSHDKQSGGFVPTELNCAELTKNTFGPEVGMAEYLHERYPEEEFFIIKCAVGGTCLWRDWISPSCGDGYDPTSFADQAESATYNIDHGLPMRPAWCYNELVKITSESLSTLKEWGYEPTVKGFCWMQGEADACDPAFVAEYERRFAAMIGDFTKTFAPYTRDMKVVDAAISEIWPQYREINAIKEHYAAANGGIYLDTISHGLTTAHEPEGAVDIYHYDSGSVVALGRLFAASIF
jgi:hypothetical protein